MILACQNRDPDTYFARELPDDALKDCLRCPIRKACEEQAYRHGEQGWWGGTSEEAREARRRAVGGVADRIRMEDYLPPRIPDPPRWREGRKWENYRGQVWVWKKRYRPDLGPIKGVDAEGFPTFYTDEYEFYMDMWNRNLKEHSYGTGR